MTRMDRRSVLKGIGTGALSGTAVALAGTGAVGAEQATPPSTAETPVTLVPPDDDGPFNYPYFLYAPQTVTEGDRPILVEPNNTGSSTDNFSEHREAARDTIENGFSRGICDELGVPLLVPVFPRPESDPVSWRHYTHQLDTETMHISSGPLERLDLQLIGMIEDAKDRLSGEISDQVMMNGYSAAGKFVNRFTVLHPEIVTSVTAGGINGMVTLPIAEDKGHKLNYQIGIADFESIMGEPFDLEAFREVDQYIYMGAEDENDTLPAGDAWSDEQREVARDVYGENMQNDRFPYCESIYENVNSSAEFRLYDGVGHKVTAEMNRDVVEFHRTHADIPNRDTQTPNRDTQTADRDVDIMDLLDAFGIPAEAAFVGSILTLGGLSYLLHRMEND
jgi:hypothetical protein